MEALVQIPKQLAASRSAPKSKFLRESRELFRCSECVERSAALETFDWYGGIDGAGYENFDGRVGRYVSRDVVFSVLFRRALA
jgi:hypothetical protein